jgi:hypothetical protein
VHEKQRGSELWEMGGPKLLRLLGRVKRIREDEQPIDESRFGSGQHGSLTSAIRVSPEEHSTGNLLPYCLYGVS